MAQYYPKGDYGHQWNLVSDRIAYPLVRSTVFVPPDGSIAFADFAKDRYFLGQEIALVGELLVEDAANWGAWSPAANIQDGTGLIYNEVAGGVPVFSPAIIDAMLGGFSLFMECSFSADPPFTPPPSNPFAAITIRAFDDPPGLRQFQGTWSMLGDVTAPLLEYASVDDFGGIIFSGGDSSHSVPLTNPFWLGITMLPAGSITVTSNGFNPVTGTGVPPAVPWTGIALDFTDQNLETGVHLILNQLTVYSPALSTGDLNQLVQLQIEYSL